MSKIFLLFFLLLFSHISSIETILAEEDKQAIEINIGSKVEYDQNRNNFQFEYKGSNESKIVFDLDSNSNLYLTYPEGKIITISDEYPVNLTENGTYYLEVVCKRYTCELGGTFKSFLIGGFLETIDLSKNVYFNDINFGFRESYYDYNHNYNNCITVQYKVSGLKEDKYVYFMNIPNNKYDGYVPFYPDKIQDHSPYYNPDPDSTIFEIYNINKNETEKYVKLYKFEKNNDYIITIHNLIDYYSYRDYYGIYLYYPEYFFSPITSENYKIITGEEDLITSNGPFLGFINPSTIIKNISLFVKAYKETPHIFKAISNGIIEYNPDNLTNISNLEFTKVSHLDIIKSESNPTVLVFILPFDYESKNKMYFAERIDIGYNHSYTIPANTAKIIYCENDNELSTYNNIITFSSKEKNLHVINSEEKTDYIIQNYETLPIFIEKSNQEQTINVEYYSSRYTFFGAENPYIFSLYFNNSEEFLGINLKNYMNLTQMNLRINSKYIYWLEFYNFYMNKLNTKINIYIKQLYGGSDLFLCDADDYDEKNLQFLITPISNKKCKNKKSIFNKLFTLDGTSVLSGYITPDSYFDIYAEINHENEDTNIKINPLMISELEMNNAAKYLKKGIKYTLSFEANHMVKLEPGFNAEVTITNGKTVYKLNSNGYTVEISGTGYVIESNNDAMVYFIGRFSGYKFIQREIDIERSKGKIVMLTDVQDKFFIDIGFKGYYPSSPSALKFRTKGTGTHYLYNIYDKLKEKLVRNEKVFVYYEENKNANLDIKYIGTNLENKNNEYNIFLIPANNETKNATSDESYELIINSIEYATQQIQTDFHFCNGDAIVDVTIYTDNNSNRRLILTKENYRLYNNINLFRGDNMMSFKTTERVVFTYSFIDATDRIYESNYKNLWPERQQMIILKIDEVTYKSDNNKIIVTKFRPNYKYSTTRYIILIGQKNSENTLKNFNNPCYLVDLLNNRPKDVVIDTIYDIGDNDIVTAEVDISEIIHNEDKYVINIISQELRFKKGINFYEPLEFSHNYAIPYEGNAEIGSNDGEKSDNESDSSNTTLVLAITLPIAGVLIIAVVVFVFLRKKDSVSSDNIEKLN